MRRAEKRTKIPVLVRFEVERSGEPHTLVPTIVLDESNELCFADDVPNMPATPEARKQALDLIKLHGASWAEFAPQEWLPQ